MKVLQVNSVCGRGSTGRIAVDLYRTLEENGDECRIAFGRGQAPQGIDTIRIGSNLTTVTHAGLACITDRSGFYSTTATKAMIKEMKSWNPDIVHLHNIHGYYLNIEVLFQALFEINKPIVWTLHDCWAFTGHCAYFDDANCSRWRIGCGSCIQKTRYPPSFVFDSSARNFIDKRNAFLSVSNLTLVTPSEWLASLVNQSFLARFNTRVIHNGIDLSVFHPVKGIFRESNNIQGRMVLGVASIWDHRKGLDHFIKLRSILDPQDVIVLVGLSEWQKRTLPPGMIGIVRTESVQDLVQLYTAADIFLNPTLEDNFPTVNIEALACGTPVITYQTGGSAECLTPECGLAVPKGDIQGLFSAIMSMPKTPAREEACISRSFQFSKEQMYTKYARLYREKAENGPE